MSLPAMSGAEPCTGSYSPLLPSPSEAEGSMPIEPVSIAAASDRMSPNMLGATMTSNCFGARISCIDAASTNRCVSSTSGYCLPTRGDGLAPQLHRLEHVGLVHRAELAAARSRGAEADVRDALDLGLGVAHGVHAFAPARRADADAARLAVVDVAVQLAQDHEVEPLHQLGLERRGADQLGEQERRPEVGKQLQLAPQREQAEPRALVARAALVAGNADRAEQDRVGLARQLERRRRQRHARRRPRPPRRSAPR